MLLARAYSWSFLLVVAWVLSASLAVADPDQATSDPPPANDSQAVEPADTTDPAEAKDNGDESAEPSSEGGELPPTDEQPSEPETPAPDPEPMPGQADLDKATELKLTAKDGRQISEVIKLLASALEKGLDDENKNFAEQMLASTLMERGKGLSQLLLAGQASAAAAQDPRWIQLRLIALSDLTNAVRLDPSEFEGFLLIGRLQFMPGGDANAAIAALNKVIEAGDAEDKIKAEAFALRGVAAKDDQAKLADLSKAIELDGSKVSYLLMRARQHLSTKAMAKALADIDGVIKANPDNYAAHELRGVVLTEMGDSEAALQSFDRASELDENNAIPYLQRGELFRKLGNLEQGIDQATKAIERSEENPLGYLLRAELYLNNKQYEEAIADAEKVLKLRPGFSPAIFLKARAYDDMGETVKALEQLEALAAAMPDQMQVNLQIAIFALKLEMPRRAITALDRAIELTPDEPLLYRYRADARLNIAEHSRAIDDYNKALELDPEDSGVLNNLAWTLATSSNEKIRNGKRAVELALKACELTEYELAHILSTLAAAYAESGDYEKAKEWAKKAVDKNDSVEDEEQLSAELASYERGEPWREDKQLDAGEREGAEPSEKPDERRTELEKPSGSTPAPRRSIDF